MPTSNHTKQILIGNFKTQSHVFCTAFFCSKVSKTTWNVLNCYVNLTNRFHVAARLFSSRLQLTTKCGIRTKKWRAEPCGLNVTISASCNIAPLQFWNITLHLGILPYKSLEIFSACTVLSYFSLYNAAASPASRLRSAYYHYS